MLGKVLLINHGAALLTDSLVSGLRSMDLSVVQVEPEVERIGMELENANVLLLFAGEFMYESPEVLVFLKDLCFGEEKALCIVGYSKEIAEVEEIIPKSMIEREFPRPVDVKGVCTALCAIVSAGGSRVKNRHILLVDDDVMFLQMMQKWLSQHYRVTVVKSGMQAITYIAAHRPDLILLDYEMPITSGPKVLEMIKSEPSSAEIPVIFLTGKDDRNSVMNAMRLKPDGYLLKSMSKEAILRAVDHFFASHQWMDEF